MADVAKLLAQSIGADKVRSGDDIGEDYPHDESPTVEWAKPAVLGRVSL